MAEESKKYRLKPMEQRFCEFYPWASSGKEAAILAGYAEKSARSQASRLLTKDSIVAEISRQREIGAKRAKITPEEVIARVKLDIDGARKAGSWPSVMKGNDLLGRKLGIWRDTLEVKPSNDAPHHQNFAAIALSAAKGDRPLARRIFRGFERTMGSEEVFGPGFSDEDIDALLDGATTH